jgi:lysozyme
MDQPHGPSACGVTRREACGALSAATGAAFASRPALASWVDADPAGTTRLAITALAASGVAVGIGATTSDNDLDFALLGRTGISFAYLKASQSATSSDLGVPRRTAVARDAGLAVGLYHFFEPLAETARQVDNFSRRLAAARWNLPPFVDCVWAPRGARGESLSAEILAFASAVEVKAGVKPLIYTRKAFADRYFEGRLRAFPLFLADTSASAPSGLDLPAGWTSCDFWHVGAGVIDDPALERLDIFAFKGGAAMLDSLAAKTRNG